MPADSWYYNFVVTFPETEGHGLKFEHTQKQRTIFLKQYYSFTTWLMHSFWRSCATVKTEPFVDFVVKVSYNSSIKYQNNLKVITKQINKILFLNEVVGPAAGHSISKDACSVARLMFSLSVSACSD